MQKRHARFCSGKEQRPGALLKLLACSWQVGNNGGSAASPNDSSIDFITGFCELFSGSSVFFQQHLICKQELPTD
jgi:hypothetical protein